MKNIEKKDKRKIVLSLLIAMAFILPATSAFGSNSVEEDEAGDIRTTGGNNPANSDIPTRTTFSKSLAIDKFTNGDNQQPVAMGSKNCWPVEVDEILVLENIPEGDYKIPVKFCRPNYYAGDSITVDGCQDDDYTLIGFDTDQEGCCEWSESCDVWYQQQATGWSGPHSLTKYFGAEFEIFGTNCNGIFNVTACAPFTLGAGDWIQIYADTLTNTGRGEADWIVRYTFDTGAFQRLNYDGSVWGSWTGSIGSISARVYAGTNGDCLEITFPAYNYCYNLFAGRAFDKDWHHDLRDAYMVTPCSAYDPTTIPPPSPPANPPPRADPEDTSGWLNVTCHELEPLEIKMAADCDDIYWFFNNSYANCPVDISKVHLYVDFDGDGDYDTGEYFRVETTVKRSDGSVINDGDVAGHCSKAFEFSIPRDEFPDHPCYCFGWNWTYLVYSNCGMPCYAWNSGWGTGSPTGITPDDWIDSTEITSFDNYPAEIKKFLEIYKKFEDPKEEVEIYTTDFEDPCEIYDNWATIDKPAWGDNQALDTWTWTDKRSSSPEHSMHSTSFDTYLGNQLDYLVLNMGDPGLNLTDKYGSPQFDEVMVNFAHWMQGDWFEIGDYIEIQDGGYVEWTFDGSWTDGSRTKTYYETDGWEDEVLKIGTTGKSALYLRWVFFSDPVKCYEGWYIDDVTITGIIDPPPRWEFITDSHSNEQIMEGECLVHEFAETWHATEGTYKICAWLQTLDECHYAVHTGDNMSTMKCKDVEVGDILELGLDCTKTYALPPDPVMEGTDVDIYTDVFNDGTLDATDVEVNCKVQYGVVRTVFSDDVESAPYPTNVYKHGYFSGESAYEDQWHVTTFGGSNAWMFSDPTTHIYPNSVHTSDHFASNFLAMGITNETFSAGDWALNPTLIFKAKWIFDEHDYVSWGLHDNGTGHTTFWGCPGCPTSTLKGYPQLFICGVKDTWTTVEFDLNTFDLFKGAVTDQPERYNGDDLRPVLVFYSDDVDNDPGLGWSGILIDDVEIKKIEVQEEPVLFEDTFTIPQLNASYWPSTEGETKTANFTWHDASVGRFVFTEQVLIPSEGTETDEPGNNKCMINYRVVNVIDKPDKNELESVDLTGGEDHWGVEACCGGYFWCGETGTGVYGNDYNDVLLLAPEKNPTLDLSGYGSVKLEFDTWYQMNDSDYGIVEYSPDDGLGWYPLPGAMFTGKSLTMFPSEPDKEGWEHHSYSLLSLSSTYQIRFRFVSNETEVNRGWILDNIELEGSQIFGPDPCEDFDNFIHSRLAYGDWWRTPDQFGYQPGWGCYDPDWIAHGLWTNMYPLNLNNALDWTVDTSTAFYGWLDGVLYTETDDPNATGIYHDYGLMEYSRDGGPWDEIENVSGYGVAVFGPWDLENVIWDPDTGDHTDELTVRWRFISNNTEDTWGGDLGYLWEDFVYYGMEDKNAPTTTIAMEGIFDSVYHYYTSEVTVYLTATDDISGVDKIYYELDGETYTYTSPFSVKGDGEHTLCYWSVDRVSNEEEKHCVTPFRIDETGPSVTITAPGPGLFLFGNKILDLDSGKSIHLFGGVQVSATVTIDDAPLKVVEFYMNDVKFAELASGPFEVFCKEKNSGSATFKVVAIDVLGESNEASITVDTYIKIL